MWAAVLKTWSSRHRPAPAPLPVTVRAVASPRPVARPLPGRLAHPAVPPPRRQAPLGPGSRERPERGFGGLGVGAGASQPHTAENGLGGRAMSASPRPRRPFPAPRPALLQGLALGTCLHTRLRGDSGRSSIWRPHCAPPPPQEDALRQ